MTKSYLGPFNEAMKRLLENDNDVEKANLAKEQFVVVLTLGFNSFTRFGSKKLDDLRGYVKVEIAKNYEGRVVPYFWLRQQQKQVEVASKKRTLPQSMVIRNLLINGRRKKLFTLPPN